MSHYCVKKYSDIPFAHRAPFHDGHCRFIHGHNWSFEFHFKASERDMNGFVVDFGKLTALKNRLKALDHSLLISEHDAELSFIKQMADRGLAELVISQYGTSSEHLAEEWCNIANDILRKMGESERVQCIKVIVTEDSKNSAIYDCDI
jgi:6-pyruvoyltetrahydropterin/6-carboxytetrahydropterin synthase